MFEVHYITPSGERVTATVKDLVEGDNYVKFTVDGVRWNIPHHRVCGFSYAPSSGDAEG